MPRLAALAALVLSLALAACGGASTESDAPAPAGADVQATVSASPSPAPAPPSPEPPFPAEAAAAPAQTSAPVEDEATLWVTRDGGRELVLEAVVSAGITVIQALDTVADIETRYGGRYVQAIDGIEGDLVSQDDWFFLVNGIEPDLGAAEVKVRAGDVVWWDFRSWINPAGHPAAVVGAFPEPFVNGWRRDGRPVEVRAPDELSAAAAGLRELVGRSGEGKPHLILLEVDAAETGAFLEATMGNKNGSPVTLRLRGARAAVEAAASRLAADPAAVRFRYTARFDADGRVVE